MGIKGAVEGEGGEGAGQTLPRATSPGPRPPGLSPIVLGSRQAELLARGVVWPLRQGHLVPVWRCSPAQTTPALLPSLLQVSPGPPPGLRKALCSAALQSLSQVTEPEGLPEHDSAAGDKARRSEAPVPAAPRPAVLPSPTC